MDRRLDGFPAVLFDLDGVLTDTASIHSDCWKSMFDDYLRERAAGLGEDFVEFDIAGDYHRYVDGVRSFLASRGIELPDGDPSDPPGSDTVCALGNRKNELVNDVLRRDGVTPYPGSMRLLDELAAAGVRMAVVSSSKNAPTVLAAAGISERFETVVDGAVAAAAGLPGKPAPDTFLAAAETLGVGRGEAVVVEDAISGRARRRASFRRRPRPRTLTGPDQEGAE